MEYAQGQTEGNFVDSIQALNKHGLSRPGEANAGSIILLVQRAFQAAIGHTQRQRRPLWRQNSLSHSPGVIYRGERERLRGGARPPREVGSVG